ncbi:MAG: hypothetical protein KKE94_10480 [Gammaproteobacteria bacterium]|nr:hypothetical protein [Gammaproteobacteria bacterium]
MRSVFAVAIAIISLPLSASSIPLTQALELCRAEQNALRRLTCYDSIQHTAAQQNNTAAQALPVQATPAAKATVKADSSDSFGMEHTQNSDDLAEQLAVTVKSVDYNQRKELIVEFDNGQRWRQVGSDYYSIKAGQQHIIKRGVLNSFFLANNNNNRTIRIRREQ